MGKISNKKPRKKSESIKLTAANTTADELKTELSVPGTEPLVTTDKSGPDKSDLSVSKTVNADSMEDLSSSSETTKKKKKMNLKRKKDKDSKSSDAVQNEAEGSGVESESDFLSKSKVSCRALAIPANSLRFNH